MCCPHIPPRTACCATTRHTKDDQSAHRSCIAVAALATLVTFGAATHTGGQTLGPEERAAQSQLLVLSPTIALTNVGWDDNIYRVSKPEEPIGDFTATLSPALQASLRVGRFNVTGRSRLDFIYFQRTSQFNSIDGDSGVRVELMVGRFLPYVGGAWANTRHDRNFEIDLPIRRITSSGNMGVDLRLSGKTSVGVMRQQSRVDYTGDTIYRGTDLAATLNGRSIIDAAKVRYRVTPLTTVGVVFEQDRSEFATAAERNSDGFRVISVVDFQPLAAVSGTAHVGVRRRKFVDGTIPPFEGTVAGADLAYTLLGRTRFSVSGQRDLAPSYQADQRDYLQTGIELSVTHRLGNMWDVGGTVGRLRLDYGVGGRGAISTSPAEKVYTHGVIVGYRLERMRIDLRVARQTRTSDFLADRRYQATQVVSSVSYGF